MKLWISFFQNLFFFKRLQILVRFLKKFADLITVLNVKIGLWQEGQPYLLTKDVKTKRRRGQRGARGKKRPWEKVAAAAAAAVSKSCCCCCC